MNRQSEEKLMEAYKDGFKDGCKEEEKQEDKRSKIMIRKKELQLMKSYEDGFKNGYEIGKGEAAVATECYDEGIRIGLKMLNNLLKRFVRADAYLETLPYIEHIVEAHGGTLEEEKEGEDNEI